MRTAIPARGQPAGSDPGAAVAPWPRSPGRPRDERASQAIAEAALHQLDSLGYGQITMESVALEAHVSRATVYRRYRDKADLVTAAIAAQSMAYLAADPAADPRAALVGFLEEFDGRFGESCLEVIGGLAGAREDPGAMAMHRERVVAPRSAQALSLLQEAQRRGQLAQDADLRLALQMLAGSVFFRRVSGQMSDPGWAERAVAAIWAGMGPGRDQRRPGSRPNVVTRPAADPY
jgi:AcrR family transcriptional regulator